MAKQYSILYSNIDRLSAIICIFIIIYQYLSYDMFKINNNKVGLYNIKDSDDNIQSIDSLLGCNDIVSLLDDKKFNICRYYQYLPVILSITLGLLSIGLLHKLRIIGLVSGLLAIVIGILELINIDNIKENICISKGITECNIEIGFSYYIIYALIVFGSIIVITNLLTFKTFGGKRNNPYSNFTY